MEALTVLVVDDDDDVLKLVRRTLEHQGWTVITTRTPFGVTTHLEKHHPDVMVLDLMMPGLDGDAVAQFAGRLGDRPPIVFYSAADEDRLRALVNRTLDARYVRKGSPLEELVAAIRESAERGQPRAVEEP